MSDSKLSESPISSDAYASGINVIADEQNLRINALNDW